MSNDANKKNESDMNEIVAIFQEMNLPPEVLASFAQKAQKNPMLALVEIRKYLKGDTLQRLLSAFAKNREEIVKLGEQMGLPEHQLKSMREVLEKNK